MPSAAPRCALLALAAVLLFPARAISALPATVGFQGRANDAAGKPLTATVSLTLRYYGDPSASTSLYYAETVSNVAVRAGLFSTLLGSGAAQPVTGGEPSLAQTLLDHDAVYVETTVNTDAPMTPRAQLVAVPFAVRAAATDTVAGFTPGAFVHTAALSNISGKYTYLDNPLCNNDPTALLVVTARLDPPGVSAGADAQPLGVTYFTTGANAGHWAITNTSNTNVPLGAVFNVLVMKP